MNVKNFGLKLRFLRESSHLSQSELANRIGVARRTIYSWEHGITNPRYLDTFEGLSSFFQIDIRFFIPTTYLGASSFSADKLNKLQTDFQKYQALSQCV